MKHRTYEAIKSDHGQINQISDKIVIEGALQININGSPYTVIMRTPGNDFDLIRGLLFAEDIYKSKKHPKFNLIEEKPNGFAIVDVSLKKSEIGAGYLNKRTLLSVSSCGICGKQDLKSIKLEGNKIQSKYPLNKFDFAIKFNLFKERQHLFQQTGGSHAAAIFGLDNNILACAEDIGRHNAVDKVIGYLKNQEITEKPTCMLVSGRVSYEIIAKAFMARIPIIAAVSACSSLSIDYAKELGITLIGFTRGKRYTMYS